MSSRARVWTAFLAIYLIWGSTYLAIRIAIETIPPFLMAGARYSIAGLLLLAWLRLRGETKTTWLEWREASIVGGLMLLGGNGAVSWAEQFVPSGLAALLVSTIPIWVVLLDWLWLRSARPGPRMFLGLALGIMGVGLLLRPGAAPAAPGGVSILGAAVLLLAAGSWAAGGLYARRARLPSSSLLSVAMQMIAGGILLFVAGTVMGEWPRLHVQAISTRSLLALGYLVIFGSLVGLTSYLWLIKNTTPAKASTYAFVNPVVAIVLGWAIAGEALSPRILLATAVALSGVVLIVRGRRAAPGGA
jgi:drug/metabolite transporter (DMT)-like permease